MIDLIFLLLVWGVEVCISSRSTCVSSKLATVKMQSAKIIRANKAHDMNQSTSVENKGI